MMNKNEISRKSISAAIGFSMLIAAVALCTCQQNSNMVKLNAQNDAKLAKIGAISIND